MERIWIGLDLDWIRSFRNLDWIGELELQELQWIYTIWKLVKLEKGITKHPLFSTSSAPYFLGT